MGIMYFIKYFSLWGVKYTDDNTWTGELYVKLLSILHTNINLYQPDTKYKALFTIWPVSS